MIGGEDMTLDEINTVGEAISRKMSPDATVMWGARIVPEYGSKMQVITIITGVKSPYILSNRTEEQKAITRAVSNQYESLGIRMFA